MTFIVNMKFHHHFIHFFCHADVNECASDPCLHGGTCVDGINSYRCLCPPGWGGAHCQLDSDECSGSPCVNAHSCQDLQGGYKCHCQTGWTGKNCDISRCPDLYPYIKTQDHVFQKCNEIYITQDCKIAILWCNFSLIFQMYKVDQIEAISQNCDTILICGSQFMLTGSHENIAVDDTLW